MLNYATVGSNDLERAKTFYDALLIPLGMQPIFEHPSGGRLYGRFGKGAFGVLGAYDGGEATVGKGVTIGFQFDAPEELKVSKTGPSNSVAATKVIRAPAAATPRHCTSPTSGILTATSCAATT